MEAIDFINIIQPEHDRTSCDDENTNNGFFSKGTSWYGRCTRCMYLEIIKGNKLPEGFDHEEL